MGLSRSILKKYYLANLISLIGLPFAAGQMLPFGFWNKAAVAIVAGCNAINAFGPNFVVDGTVRSIVSDGTVTYIGGDFTTVGGLPRSRIAAFQNSDGSLLPFAPTVNGPVNALSLNGGKLYVGGLFSSVGTGINTTTKAVEANTSLTITPGFPEVNQRIMAAASDGSGGWYIAGEFTTVGGVARNYIAQVNSDGTVSSFAPTVNGTVTALAVKSGIIYFAGNFTSVNSTSRLGAAAVNTSGVLQAFAPNINPDYSFFVDRPISAIGFNGTDVIMSGIFKSVNVQSTANAIATVLDGSSYKQFPVISGGSVLASIPDGAGGWIIGGTFSSVGGTARRGLARLNSNGTLNATWNPAGGTQRTVTSLATDGTVVYVGGTFTQMGGQSRTNLAAVYMSNGNATTLIANTDAQVTGLALDGSGSDLYVSGDFVTIKGSSRNYLAKLSTADFSVSSWNPNPNANVNTIDVEGSVLYVGGGFSYIGSASRAYVAGLDTTTGAATSFNPIVNQDVYDIEATSTGVFLYGAFGSVNGATRSVLVEVDLAGALTTWVADAMAATFSTTLSRIVASSDRVYLIQPSSFFAGGLSVMTRSTGALDPTFPLSPVGEIQSIAVSGTEVLLAGGVSGLGTLRNMVASFDENTGLVSSFDAQLTGFGVTSMDIDSGRVFLAGYVYGSASQPRSGLLSLNAANLSIESWAPTSSLSGNAAIITKVVVAGTSVIVGGNFDTLAGTARTNLGAVSASTGAIVSGFNPGTTLGAVSDIASDGTYLYVSSNNVKGTKLRQHSIASGAAVVGTMSNFSSTGNPPSLVRYQASKLLVSGDWTSTGGSLRSNLAAFDTTTAAVETFAPEPDGEVNAMVNDGSTRLYIGGAFNNIGATGRAKVGAITMSTGAVVNWTSSANGRVRAMQLNAGNTILYVGGEFTMLRGSTARNYIGALNTGANTVATWNPNSNGYVHSLLLSGTNMYVGGEFTSIGGGVKTFAAKIPVGSNTASTWNPDLNAYVFAMSEYGGNIYLGGNFTTIGATSRSNLGVVDNSSGSLVDWQPNANSAVRALRAASGALWVGGDFTSIAASATRQRYGVISTCQP